MKMGIEKILEDKRVVAIVCNQFGDTGKGKFSDYLSEHWADVCTRANGGNNAGHTVKVGERKIVFHLLPSSILHDSKGVKSVLGNGMVIDLDALVSELEMLERKGLTYNNLMISKDAHLVLPYHVSRDMEKNAPQKDGGIGTTGRGVGLAYEDKVARRGIMVMDLFDKDIVLRKIRKARDFYSDVEIEEESIIVNLMKNFEKIRHFVFDTVNETQLFLRNEKKILLEGSQGLLLSVEHGTYPYVTSSDCSVNGMSSGAGLSSRAIDLVFGIYKFPFMTRVGAGPFPTEIGGIDSERYCALDKGNRKVDELKKYSVEFSVQNGNIFYEKNQKIVDLMNSSEDFVKGVGIRLAADEYGSTTGRPRRVGWTDAVTAKYAANINGNFIAVLTKMDALAGINDFKICYRYKIGRGLRLDFNRDEKYLREVECVYRKYKGYGEISDIKNYIDLPPSLKAAIEDFEGFIRQPVGVISLGPDRENTILAKFF